MNLNLNYEITNHQFLIILAKLFNLLFVQSYKLFVGSFWSLFFIVVSYIFISFLVYPSSYVMSSHQYSKMQTKTLISRARRCVTKLRNRHFATFFYSCFLLIFFIISTKPDFLTLFKWEKISPHWMILTSIAKYFQEF